MVLIATNAEWFKFRVRSVRDGVQGFKHSSWADNVTLR